MIIPRHAPSTLVSFLALAILSGACASTDNQGAAAGSDITKAADEIKIGLGQLDATLLSLNTLVNEPPADLEAQYKVFTKNLDQLESTAKRVREATESMEARGQAYFADWDTQIAAIQNEDLRSRSAERREAVEASFSEIREDYRSAQEEFQPLMNDLRDIRTALGADLTMDGLDAVKKTTKHANESAEDVKETLEELSAGFRKLGVSLSNAGPAPQPTQQ